MNILVCGRACDYLTEDLFDKTCKLFFHKNEYEGYNHPETIDIVICNAFFLHNDIRQYKRLKMVQLLSAGMDRVPVDYIKDHGIVLRNAQDVYSIPIAEYTVGRILEWYKRFRETDRLTEIRKWEKLRMLPELQGKTVCIYGYGRIGRAISQRLKGFGVKLYGVTIEIPDDSILDEWMYPDKFKQISGEIDILILTLPLTNETWHLVNKDFICWLNPKCLIVNVARGALIDNDALGTALKEGMVSGAILDVFESEPLKPDSEEWSFENTLISPHNSFEGEGNADRLRKLIVENILEYEVKSCEKGRFVEGTADYQHGDIQRPSGVL